MANEIFKDLDSVSFLQTFVTESIKTGKIFSCPSCAREQTQYIEHLGLKAAGWFESLYRQNRDLEGPLSVDDYLDLILGLKNEIGGRFTRASSEQGVVRVICTRCPFGDKVKQAPELCQMTSSVFGGIGARNFGYAKVGLPKRIAAGDDICEACITFDPERATPWDGDEYRLERDMVVGRSVKTEVSARIEKSMGRVWSSRSNGKKAEEGQRPVVVAASPAMHSILESVEVVAPTSATVLITGETGAGKEIIARAVHATSTRWRKRFVAVNCGAIPEGLVESALFGHEKGAFTNAYEVHQGYFERAEGGTLFLDEIDSLPLPAQVRLLRVMQDGEFERVGGKQSLSADVRVVAAGTRDLAVMAETGAFRKDLFYRLNVVPIHIPALRERPDDIPPLVQHILERLAQRYRKPIPVVTQTVMKRLKAHDWPGNVRELENVLERALLFADGGVLAQVHLPPNSITVTADGGAGQFADMSLKGACKAAADQTEARILRSVLRECDGNITAAAKRLRLSQRAVYQKLHGHGIDPTIFRGHGWAVPENRRN